MSADEPLTTTQPPEYIISCDDSTGVMVCSAVAIPPVPSFPLAPAERGTEFIPLPIDQDPCILYQDSDQGTTQYGLQPCSVSTTVADVPAYLPETGANNSIILGFASVLLIVGVILTKIACREAIPLRRSGARQIMRKRDTQAL